MSKFQGLYPEDVFGELTAANVDGRRREIAKTYRDLARETHPDHGGDAADFTRLSDLYRAALEAVVAGTYGKRGAMVDAVVVRTRRHAYRLSELASRGEHANIYEGTFVADDDIHGCKLAVGRRLQDGKYLANEAKVLKDLLSVGDDLGDMIEPYLPRYIEAFGYRSNSQTRQAIAFRYEIGAVSLRDVYDAYPDGVDPRDSAWMLRRLLIALGLTHAAGYCHGRVNVDSVLIYPEEHGLVLTNWTEARDLDSIKNAKSRRRAVGNDIQAGVGAIQEITSKSMPSRLANWYGAVVTGYSSGLPEAFDLRDEFDEIIESLWGPRKFRPFVMTGAA